MPHHRSSFARVAAARMESTGRTATAPQRAMAAIPTAPPLWADDYRSHSCPTWAGRQISKWCRSGRWDETGTLLYNSYGVPIYNGALGIRRKL